MTANRIMMCMGTRPEVIKCAPVYDAFCRLGEKPMIVHTGQHDEIAESMYRFFGMVPDLKLRLEAASGQLGHRFSSMMSQLEDIVEREETAAVLVQGDTSSAFAGGLTAFYNRIPVGHIEAGLRSHVAYNPFPEEKNRELIARLTQWHFAPTHQAMENLRREGIASENCYLTGNTIVDAISLAGERTEAEELNPPSGLDDLFETLSGPENRRRLVLVTAHRRESWDRGIAGIAEGIARLADQCPDLCFVWPVHPNPIVEDQVTRVLGAKNESDGKQIWLCDPLAYPVLIWLLERALFVVTDSGGIQEEAVTLKVPVLVAREYTERPEVVNTGAGRIIGTDPDTIASWGRRLVMDAGVREAMQSAENPFGDGRAAERIAGIVMQELAPRRMKRQTPGVAEPRRASR